MVHVASSLVVLALEAVSIAAAITPRDLVANPTDPAVLRAAAIAVTDNLMSYYVGNAENKQAGWLVAESAQIAWWESSVLFTTMLDWRAYTKNSTWDGTIGQAILSLSLGGKSFAAQSPAGQVLSGDDIGWAAQANIVANEQGVTSGSTAIDDTLSVLFHLAGDVCTPDLLYWKFDRAASTYCVRPILAHCSHVIVTVTQSTITNALFIGDAARQALAVHNSASVTQAIAVLTALQQSGLATMTAMHDGLSAVPGRCTINQQAWSYHYGGKRLSACVDITEQRTELMSALTWLAKADPPNAPSYTFFGNAIFEQSLTTVAQLDATWSPPRRTVTESCEPSHCNSDTAIFKGIYLRDLAYFYPLAGPDQQAAIQHILTDSIRSMAETSCTDDFWCSSFWKAKQGPVKDVREQMVAASLLIAAIGVFS